MSVSLTCMVDRQPGNEKLNIWDKIRKPEATIYKEQSPRLGCKFIQLSTDVQVWSGPSLLINRIIGYYRMFQWRANVRMRLGACAGWSEYMHFVHVWRPFFFCLMWTIYILHKFSWNFRELETSGWFCTIFKREISFVTFWLYLYINPIWKRVHSKRKEFAPRVGWGGGGGGEGVGGHIVAFYRVDPFQMRKKTILTELPSPEYLFSP